MSDTQTRVFGRRVAVELLTPEEIGLVAAGGPFTLPKSTPETWCELYGDVQETDDCGSD
jgi:hypothetical protein